MSAFNRREERVALKRTARSRADGAGLALAVAVLAEGGGALPEYASPGAAGADLRASEALEIPPGGRAAVSTGLRLAIPSGFVGLVWPRSGLAVRHGVDTLAGVVDSDYRGEVRVVLQNHGREPFRVAPGDRIAQLLVQPVVRAAFAHGQGLADTERGEGGFGSTGR
jgi:dUTP pyrophosphatase